MLGIYFSGTGNSKYALETFFGQIDAGKCVACGKCVELCPMKNLNIENNIAKAGNRCTMCYRCINICPKQAITLLGKRVVEQGMIEKYL